MAQSHQAVDSLEHDRPRPTTLRQARDLVGEPEALAAIKVRRTIDEHFHRFIAHSPLCCIASVQAGGGADCSPRGDYPGFVKVLDESTLLVPDRIGNNRIDTFENIDSDPRVGLIFFVPGHRETLRVNGRAYLTDDEKALQRLQAEGRLPQLAMVVEVEEAFVHCGRAIIRSRLWDPASTALAGHVPTMGEIVVDQLDVGDMSASDLDQHVETGYEKLF